MASILYKWLITFAIIGVGGSYHPIFVSVTEIEHNSINKTLEISCKIFTDDLETTLRKKYNTKVDLLDVKFRATMNPLVNDYIQKHLSIIADGKKVDIVFLGFEPQEEGIVSYYEAKNITSVKKMEVVNDILYEYKPQQMEIIHVMVNGERKSSRLNNPDDRVSFVF
jgi:coenzyme F420-reducing hydrogenase delta subunit